MASIKVVLILLLILGAQVECGKRCLTTNDCNAIDDYVWRPDNTYTWNPLDTYPMDGYTTYIINMTSQTWFNDSIHSRPIWWHYLAIHIPDNLVFTDSAMLYISSGSNTNSPPTATSNEHIRRTGELTNITGMVSATLRMTPNQPIDFYLNDTITSGLTEDGIIAYTWRIYIEELTNNKIELGPDFLLRNPMIKGCVRAMDTVTTFVKQQVPTTDIQKFIAAGESKRGWTTWILAATDDRVVAQIPIVLSCLNMVTNFNHYWRANGGWSYALGDYWIEGLLGLVNYPVMQSLADLVDPYAYRNRYTFPTYMISGSSDEFFMNDDHHYFWNDMPQGYFWPWIMENTRHSISRSPIVEEFWHNLQTFSLSVLTGWSMPQPRWTRNETETHGSITVFCDVTPKRITSFWAQTPEPDKRDWRVSYIDHTGLPEPKERNVTWFEAPVTDLGDNTYQVEMDKPSEGWIAFFIKMHFDGPNSREFTISTEANIIPDVFPYSNCRTYDECQGILM